MIRPSICIFVSFLALSGASLAQETDALETAASQMFAATFAGPCDWAFDEHGLPRERPSRWAFEETPEYGQPYTVTVFKFECNMGAYNTLQVYFIDGEYEGLRPVALALPSVEATFENGDSEGALLDWRIEGFYTRYTAVNSEFDPETGTISDHSFWRGLGDASSQSRWVRHGEDYVLKHYLYDPTYDGDINPVTVIDYTKTK